MSELNRLRNEIDRLRKALSYSELRDEALIEVLKIGRAQYGIDLLKKLLPSRRFGKSCEGYYSISMDRTNAQEIIQIKSPYLHA